MYLYDNCFYEKLFMRNVLMRSEFMINITEPYVLKVKFFYIKGFVQNGKSFRKYYFFNLVRLKTARNNIESVASLKS